MEDTFDHLAQEENMTGISILVVDDDRVIGKLMKRRLNIAGYKVTVADNGTEAMHILDQGHIDIVITDLIMPGNIGGIELLQTIKDRNAQTEVILITGHSSVETAVDAMKKGAVDYLEKPVNFDELLLRLAKICNMKSLRKNADDLREAMNVTESSAAETIRNLEMAVADMQAKLYQISNILNSVEREAHQKIRDALATLSS